MYSCPRFLHRYLRKVRHSSIFLSTFWNRSLSISNWGMTILTSVELNTWVSKCWSRILNCIALFFISKRTAFNHPGLDCFRLFFFSLSLWCLHLFRVDSCRMEGRGLTGDWACCPRRSQNSFLDLLCACACHQIFLMVVVSFPIYHLTIISIGSDHNCCAFHCRQSGLKCTLWTCLVHVRNKSLQILKKHWCVTVCLSIF